MTLIQLAKKCGVSVATVSKAFSGGNDISEKTRAKIFAQAKLDGCYDKYINKSYPKKVIGIIVPEIMSEYYTGIFKALDETIIKNNAISVLMVSDFDDKKTQEYFDYSSFYRKTDGVIIVDSDTNLKNSENIPAVLISNGQLPRQQNTDRIIIDLESGINEAVKYLKTNGHKSIAFIGESKTKRKEILFKKALENNGIYSNRNFFVETDKRFENGGYEAMKALIESNHAPTAVIAGYDKMAIGAMKYLHEKGLSVPEDISIIGMDNISDSKYTSVPITTIGLNLDELSREAVDLILKKTDSRYFKSKHQIKIECKLQVRSSVKNLNM